MEQMARGGVYDMDMMTDLMQQTYAAAIKWPKDRILTIRLEHIMEAVETDKWPVSKDFSYAEAAGLTIDEAPAAAESDAKWGEEEGLEYIQNIRYHQID